jgi:hypothetical protein
MACTVAAASPLRHTSAGSDHRYARGILIIVALLEIVVGVAIFAAAPTSIQEIAGVSSFGFGILTIAIISIAVTFERLWKEHREVQEATAAAS